MLQQCAVIELFSEMRTPEHSRLVIDNLVFAVAGPVDTINPSSHTNLLRVSNPDQHRFRPAKRLIRIRFSETEGNLDGYRLYIAALHFEFQKQPEVSFELLHFGLVDSLRKRRKIAAKLIEFLPCDRPNSVPVGCVRPPPLLANTPQERTIDTM